MEKETINEECPHKTICLMCKQEWNTHADYGGIFLCGFCGVSVFSVMKSGYLEGGVMGALQLLRERVVGSMSGFDVEMRNEINRKQRNRINNS